VTSWVPRGQGVGGAGGSHVVGGGQRQGLRHTGRGNGGRGVDGREISVCGRKFWIT
jgi:hypothetical protein